MTPDLRNASRYASQAIRRHCIQSDDNGHAAREFAFNAWLPTTLYPQAVIRWIKEIGDEQRG